MIELMQWNSATLALVALCVLTHEANLHAFTPQLRWRTKHQESRTGTEEAVGQRHVSKLTDDEFAQNYGIDIKNTRSAGRSMGATTGKLGAEAKYDKRFVRDFMDGKTNSLGGYDSW